LNVATGLSKKVVDREVKLLEKEGFIARTKGERSPWQLVAPAPVAPKTLPVHATTFQGSSPKGDGTVGAIATTPAAAGDRLDDHPTDDVSR
jgi:hypothetical protein